MPSLNSYYSSTGTQMLTEAFGDCLQNLIAADIFLMIAGIAVSAAVAVSDRESPAIADVTDRLIDSYPVEGDDDTDYSFIEEALSHLDRELDPVSAAKLLQGLAAAAFVQSQ